jgi:hypothetical protein
MRAGELCLAPAPPQHRLERSNKTDHPVDKRPDVPVCIRPAGHETPWHHAGYGLPEWQDSPELTRPNTRNPD